MQEGQNEKVQKLQNHIDELNVKNAQLVEELARLSHFARIVHDNKKPDSEFWKLKKKRYELDWSEAVLNSFHNKK